MAEGTVALRWKTIVEEFIEYVKDDLYRISYDGDSCTFRQFDASRMHFYGTVMWNESKDQMIVEMYNPHVNRIVENIMRASIHHPHHSASVGITS
ncbi:MAG: hypothetical protein MJZ38_04030 [archaeon]|nr:hypothetical protein [archaeon]